MIISIIGNIASGKSTLIKELGGVFNKDGDTSVLIEGPVDQWEFFDDFNENMEKYSFAFSMEILESFAAMPIGDEPSTKYFGMQTNCASWSTLSSLERGLPLGLYKNVLSLIDCNGSYSISNAEKIKLIVSLVTCT